MKNEPKGTRINVGEMGVAKLKTASGTTIAVDKDGNAEVNLANIKAVSIANLIDLQEYRITHVAGLISHFARFVDDGTLEFAYNTNGKLVSFSGSHVTVGITTENVVTIHKYTGD